MVNMIHYLPFNMTGVSSSKSSSHNQVDGRSRLKIKPTAIVKGNQRRGMTFTTTIINVYFTL